MNSAGWEKSGFNKEKIEALSLDVVETYSRVRGIVQQLLEDNLVRPMSTNWYAPEAIVEFKSIKNTLKGLGEDLNDAYVGFSKWLEEAAINWTKNTSGVRVNGRNEAETQHYMGEALIQYANVNAPHITYSTPQPIDLDISCIKEKDYNNNIYLHEAKANAVAQSILGLKATVLNKIKAEHGKLFAKTSFFGHGQSSAATACFVRIAELIGTFFDKLFDELNQRLIDYADKYRQVAEGISNEFKNANLNVESSEQ